MARTLRSSFGPAFCVLVPRSAFSLRSGVRSNNSNRIRPPSALVLIIVIHTGVRKVNAPP
eukprot:10086754-Lingulodinium_polyedra.AAC.1